MYPRIRRFATAAGFISAFGLALPVEAGIGVVTVNQHGPNEPNDHGDCTYCPQNSGLCPQGCPGDNPPAGCRYIAPADFNNGAEALPNPDNSSEWPEIDAFSHHVNPWRPSTGSPDWRRWRGRFCQAIAEYSPSGRPKILSTDMAGVEVRHGGDGSDVEFYLDLICKDAALTGRKGRLHFEHYDRYLNGHSEAGSCIDGWSSFPTKSRNALAKIKARAANCGVDHHPNGLLFRGTQISPNNRHKLYFTQPRGEVNTPATVLKGYGYMGALAAGERLDAESYFRILGWNGVNFTRVWAVERWNGRVESTCAPEQSEGPTPFVGTWKPAPPHGPGGDYNLDQQNPDFYKRLRSFMQEAADRGVVVQLSLYDIHGLLNYPFDPQTETECPGRFDDSPYNALHNNNGYISSTPSYCGPCSSAFGGDATEGRSGSCKGPNGFVTNSNLQANHLAYVRRVADEVGGMGNVMFEIINEAMAGLDWWDTNPRGDDWQLLQAVNFKKALPVQVARDAFNDEWLSGKTVILHWLVVSPTGDSRVRTSGRQATSKSSRSEMSTTTRRSGPTVGSATPPRTVISAA